jgi:hypothetical protein
MNINCDSQQGLIIPLAHPVHLSLGAYGNVPHQVAIDHALSHSPSDPLLGTLSTTRLQLCPQNRGRIDTALAWGLRRNHPNVEWRLHANVMIETTPRRVDLCDFPHEQSWFKQVAQLSSVLQAPAYTAHAGRRHQATVQEVIQYARESEQLFGIPVGIEGHYPTSVRADQQWLFNSWAEYQLLHESNVHFALDLSHEHILATDTQRIEWTLLQEMLNSTKCLEVHVSGNDGSHDQHQSLNADDPPWWRSLLQYTHEHAVIFSEGKQSMTDHSISA